MKRLRYLTTWTPPTGDEAVGHALDITAFNADTKVTSYQGCVRSLRPSPSTPREPPSTSSCHRPWSPEDLIRLQRMLNEHRHVLPRRT